MKDWIHSKRLYARQEQSLLGGCNGISHVDMMDINVWEVNAGDLFGLHFYLRKYLFVLTLFLYGGYFSGIFVLRQVMVSSWENLG